MVVVACSWATLFLPCQGVQFGLVLEGDRGHGLHLQMLLDGCPVVWATAKQAANLHRLSQHVQ